MRSTFSVVKMYAMFAWCLMVVAGVVLSYQATRIITSQLNAIDEHQDELNTTALQAELFDHLIPLQDAAANDHHELQQNQDAVDISGKAVEDDIINNNDELEDAKDKVDIKLSPHDREKSAISLKTLPPPEEVVPQTSRQRLSYADIYQQGRQAYLESDFQTCAMRMLHALDEHDAFKHREASCKQQCSSGKRSKKLDEGLSSSSLKADSALKILIDNAAAERKKKADEEDVKDDDSVKIAPVFEEDYATLELRYLRAALFHTSCLLTCHAELDHHANAIDPDIDAEFATLLPLDYLQICLFHIGNHAEAANIAYTFLMKHPTHEIMAQNLKYYVEKYGIKPEHIVNRMRRAYEDSYFTAMDAYNSGDFAKAAPLFELALEEYYTAENNCRAECDGHAVATSHDVGTYNYDLVWTITNKLITSLHCRQACAAEKLSFFDAKNHPKFLSTLYNYLQYSYFKSGDIEASCRALESYRLFEPNDQDSKNNEEVLEHDFAAKPEWFRTRPEASAYHMRSEAEKEILAEMKQLFRNRGHHNKSEDEAQVKAKESSETV